MAEHQRLLGESTLGRSKIVRKHFLLGALCVCCVVLYILSALQVIHNPFRLHRPASHKILHGAVSTEVSECTDIGTQILLEGGNAADAMVASVICIGIFNPHLSGLGGGGFMLVRGQDGIFETIDFRETAPGASHENMYVKNITLSLYGGLAVGAYGEPAGLEMLHRKYGRLPWAKLFAPSIALARHGLRIIPEIASNLRNPQYSFLLTDPQFAAIYAPEGEPLETNQTAFRPALADTLEEVARYGAKAMYTGRIANATVKAVKEGGGILTLSDLANYTAVSRGAATVQYRDYTLYSCPAPASGSIALSAMNILSGYDISLDANISTHLVVEALKFAYGQRTILGDPEFIGDAAALETQFLTASTASKIRSQISIDKTQDPSVYDPTHSDPLNDHGTSHLVAADSDGLVISLTSTVNTYWGSRIMVPETGILLNNEQNDFSSPNVSNAFGYIPTEANYIRPFKRPLSSISPTIVEHSATREFHLVTGAAGGSRITSATVQVLWHMLDLGRDSLSALAQPRLHDQIVPLTTTFEHGFEAGVVAGMRERGHNISMVPPGLSVALAIRRRSDGSFDAASDPRKESGSAGVV